MKELDPVWEERRKFGEQCYENIKLLGFRQYLFCDFGAGNLISHKYDEKVFELYRDNMILVSSDMKTKFDMDKLSFWNLLGAGYYISRSELLDSINRISAVICKGSEYINSKQSKEKYCIAVKK